MKTQVNIVLDSIVNDVRVTTFELTIPRIIHSQLLTHRMFSRNASSCLTGDTLITVECPNAIKDGKKSSYKKTLKEIVEKWFTGDSNGRDMKERILDMNFRCINVQTGEFTTTKIKECFKSGIKDVYEVELENGYKITCTDEHKVYTNNGWQTLGTMGLQKSTGEVLTLPEKTKFKIATNGFELSIEWLTIQRDMGKRLVDICKEFDLPVRPVRTFAEKNKIRFQKIIENPNETFEYKDKFWLEERITNGWFSTEIAKFCNTTTDRVKHKLRKFDLLGIKRDWSRLKRTEPWNKGKTYTLPEESLINVRAAAKLRSKPGSYKTYIDLNISTTRFLQEIRLDIYKKYNYICPLSGINGGFELHHIDPVWHNKELVFDFNNIILLNKTVHSFIHSKNLELDFLEYYKSGKDLSKFIELFSDLKRTCEDIKKPKTPGNKLVVRYFGIKSVLYKGKQETYDIEVTEHSNFIANGIVVHNSRALPAKRARMLTSFSPENWRRNDKGMSPNKNLGSFGSFLAGASWFTFRQLAKLESRWLSLLGIHKEQANRVLEPYQFIKVLVTSTEWNNFLRQRMDSHAQYEIRQIAIAINYHLQHSTPIERHYHLPFITAQEWKESQRNYLDHGNEVGVINCLMSSVARCARVSYLNFDGKADMDKDKITFKKLVIADPPHLSPAEHQVMEPLTVFGSYFFNEDGMIDEGNALGGNLDRRVVQLRKLIELPHVREGFNKSA